MCDKAKVEKLFSRVAGLRTVKQFCVVQLYALRRSDEIDVRTTRDDTDSQSHLTHRLVMNNEFSLVGKSIGVYTSKVTRAVLDSQESRTKVATSSDPSVIQSRIDGEFEG